MYTHIFICVWYVCIKLLGFFIFSGKTIINYCPSKFGIWMVLMNEDRVCLAPRTRRDRKNQVHSSC